MIEKKTKKLSLDAFKAKSELEKIDLDNIGGLVMAACHDKGSKTCLFPSNYSSCSCC